MRPIRQFAENRLLVGGTYAKSIPGYKMAAHPAVAEAICLVLVIYPKSNLKEIRPL
jgi:hypothetical protein